MNTQGYDMRIAELEARNRELQQALTRARHEVGQEVMKHLADEAAQNVADLRGNRDEDIQANAIHWHKTEAWLRKKIEAQARAQQRRAVIEEFQKAFLKRLVTLHQTTDANELGAIAWAAWVDAKFPDLVGRPPVIPWEALSEDTRNPLLAVISAVQPIIEAQARAEGRREALAEVRHSIRSTASPPRGFTKAALYGMGLRHAIDTITKELEALDTEAAADGNKAQEGRTAAAAIAMSFVEENLRNGGELHFPSLDITLTKENLQAADGGVGS